MCRCRRSVEKYGHVRGYNACIVIHYYAHRVLRFLHHTIHPPARKKQHLSSSALHDTAAETAWRSSSVSTFRLDVVNVNVLLAAVGLVAAIRVAVLVELEADALVALVAVRVGLVDLCVLGELAVGF